MPAASTLCRLPAQTPRPSTTGMGEPTLTHVKETKYSLELAEPARWLAVQTHALVVCPVIYTGYKQHALQQGVQVAHLVVCNPNMRPPEEGVFLHNNYVNSTQPANLTTQSLLWRQRLA